MRDITLRPILYISGPYSPREHSTTQQNIQVARDHAVKAGWKEIPGAVLERKLALEKRLGVFDALPGPECLPHPRMLNSCRYYLRTCSLGTLGDTCKSPETRCPDGAWCPLRGRCL